MGYKSVGCKALASSLKKLKAMVYPVKRAKKLYGFFLFSTILFFQVIFPQSGFSVITDTTNYLIIPVGETYISSGTHTYAKSMQIDGTLKVEPYNGTAVSGWLELICSSVTISLTGKINADGAGYRGGDGVIFSNGEGPGGGTAAYYAGSGGYGGSGGTGVYATWDTIGSGGSQYGDITNPDSLGSGGGVGSGRALGGSGGGKIRLISGGAITNNGTISANGSRGYPNDGGTGGGGSGGSIFIETNELIGNGNIASNGGIGGSEYGCGGSGGRIALYYQANSYAGNMIAYGEGVSGISVLGTQKRGGAGTIYKKSGSQVYGDVYVNNNDKLGETTYLAGRFDGVAADKRALLISSSTLDTTALILDNSGIFCGSGTVAINNVNLSNGATLYVEAGIFNINNNININQSAVLCVNSPMIAANMAINAGGEVTHSAADPDFDITVNGNLTINSGGQINVNGMGYHGGDGVTYLNGEGPGGGTAASNAGGAGYGGVGGTGRASPSDAVGYGGMSYGSMFSPAQLGSGGGVGSGRALGGAGGGKIKLVVAGALANNGTISANGSVGSHSDANGGGGGSGGSVYIIADQFSGTGIITANGGNGDTFSSAGGGAGGRIAVYYKNSYFSGQTYTNPGTGGNPLPQAGTIMLPAVTAPDSQDSISDTTVSHLTSSNLTETIAVQTGKSVLEAGGTLNGSVNISTLTLVSVKTGAFRDKGFVKGIWTAQLEGINYSGQIFAMAYLSQTERKMLVRGVMEGPLDGAIDGCLTETMPNSGAYDLLNATWTFRLTQSGGLISCGHIYLNGTLNYEALREYPGTNLTCIQASTQGTLAGGYTGAINTVVTNVRINDTTRPNNGEGFGFMTYQWDAMTGQACGYSKVAGTYDTDLKLSFNKPLLGTAAGLLTTLPLDKSLWLIITKLEIGAEPQADLSVELTGADNISPGQTVTYTVILKNEGLKSANNTIVRLNLPAEIRFLSASGEWIYDKAGESDWVNYPDLSKAPEWITWLVPEMPNKTVKIFTVQGKALWGLPMGIPLNADVHLYEY